MIDVLLGMVASRGMNEREMNEGCAAKSVGEIDSSQMMPSSLSVHLVDPNNAAGTTVVSMKFPKPCRLLFGLFAAPVSLHEKAR